METTTIKDKLDAINKMLVDEKGVLRPDFTDFLRRFHFLRKGMTESRCETDLDLATLYYDKLVEFMDKLFEALENEKRERALIMLRRLDDILKENSKLRLYEFFGRKINSLLKDEIRDKIYHNLQVKIGRMTPEDGVYPLELQPGKGKRFYSVVSAPKNEHVFDYGLPAYDNVPFPPLPAGFDSHNAYKRRGLGREQLAKLARHYHEEVAWASKIFAGQPCYVAIRVFSGWLQCCLPDLAGEKRLQKTCAIESPDNLVTPPDSCPQRLLEETEEEKTTFGKLAEDIWNNLPSRFRPAATSLLNSILDEDERPTDSEIAGKLGYSPQKFKFHKDKLFGKSPGSGILANLFVSALEELDDGTDGHVRANFVVFLNEFFQAKTCSSKRPDAAEKI